MATNQEKIEKPTTAHEFTALKQDHKMHEDQFHFQSEQYYSWASLIYSSY